jgi:hydrogenase maturation protein HypF
MAAKLTKKIRFWGIVQGVGFRPYVAKTADRLKMKGTVANVGGLVEVVVTDTEKKIKKFVDTLLEEKPAPSEIVHVRTEDAPAQIFDGFSIIQSGEGEKEITMLPADIAVCDDCLSDMNDSEDRRYRHPFISCMACGPRYTIIDRIPYDRDNTSMIDFQMCDDCRNEYENLDDRRHHAQTISCYDCGPQMKARFNSEFDDDDFRKRRLLDLASSFIKGGRVIAFKSMGGYNLMANPFDDEAVRILREIKGREEKPFALMFRDIDQIKEYCRVDRVEEKLLNSSARPIILLERYDAETLEKKRPRNYREILKSRFVGAFLPSMGAQYTLLEKVGDPVIATSANISGMPIIKDDEQMFELMEKSDIAGVFYNERDIRVSVDDSVARVIDGQPQIIRRSKGYVPVPLYCGGIDGEILACGGQLKNSFALAKEGFVYPSQFFGDMETLENRKLYEENVSRMEALLRIKPKKVVCDMHPGYFTTAFAEKYAEEKGIALEKVQHHHAHVASVVAENDIKGPVIGVSFDGTGFGPDGAVWGGEFLLCEGKACERKAHLKYIDMLGGDSSMKEAWKAAVSHMYAFEKGNEREGLEIDIADIIRYSVREDTLAERDTDAVKKALEAGINTVETSSMGRLFDAVSAMLGICDLNSYEGQCASMLEDAAAFAKREPGADEAKDLALAFHERVSALIINECIDLAEAVDWKGHDKRVVLTGGVFQNDILMEKTLSGLRTKGFKTYYNISVSPNDGGIATGQAYIAGFREEQR